MSKEDNISNIILLLAFCCVIAYCISLQFISPVLYGEDSYYHIAVSNFIKQYGMRYTFHWAQFSTFKDFFSDKDLLFHLLSIPPLVLTRNIIWAGKCAVIFHIILFVICYVYILRKYLPGFLAGCFLLLPFFSYVFTTYSLFLRPTTLVNILTILAIYFLINKKWLTVFILSLLYSLTHISFLMLVVFAIICESLRYLVNKEFFLRNIYAVVIGVLAGCFIHPNFPNNLLSLHLNFFLVPLYTNMNIGIDFGEEFFTPAYRIVFLDNFAVFFAINFIIWMSFWTRTRLSLSTFVWWAATAIYLAFSFSGNRYWHTANALFFIFFASYVKDWIGGREFKLVAMKIRASMIIFASFALIFIPTTFKNIKGEINQQTVINTHYQDIAYWMKRNIPAGETIYHTFWYDSPYFICLNPKNNYIAVLDPIYMFYRYPKEYLAYVKLARGGIEKPYEVLSRIFKVNYGYARKDAALSQQIKQDPGHFKILYENNWGFVFKIPKQDLSKD